MADDLTPELLAEIRDAVCDNGRQIDRTNDRLDQTNERLDQTNERLAVLATLTRSSDGRLEKIEARESLRSRSSPSVVSRRRR